MSDPSEYYTDSKFIHGLYKIMIQSHNILLKNNIPYYSSGGTLIGSLRHRGIIPWDDDLDIEIGYRDVERLMSKEIKEQFKKKGLSLEYLHQAKSRAPFDWIKVVSKTKVNGRQLFLDIFPMKIGREEKTGRLRTYFSSKIVNTLWPKYYLYIDELLPLKKSPFGDGFVIVPNKADKALSRAYGNDWNKVGYITQDSDHYMLEKPIKLSIKQFVPAKKFYSAKRQMDIDGDDPLLTLKGTSFI